ncbi:hypothetical protein ACVH9Z_40965 [Rhodococcus opacus]|nr:hypothetical protein [Rhodococcus opacus]
MRAIAAIPMVERILLVQGWRWNFDQLGTLVATWGGVTKSKENQVMRSSKVLLHNFFGTTKVAENLANCADIGRVEAHTQRSSESFLSLRYREVTAPFMQHWAIHTDPRPVQEEHQAG